VPNNDFFYVTNHNAHAQKLIYFSRAVFNFAASAMSGDSTIVGKLLSGTDAAK
jgi:hypothetical protein